MWSVWCLFVFYHSSGHNEPRDCMEDNRKRNRKHESHSVRMGSNATTERRDVPPQQQVRDLLAERRDDPPQQRVRDLLAERRAALDRALGDFNIAERNYLELLRDRLIAQVYDPLDLWEDVTVDLIMNPGQEKCYDPNDATLTFVDGEDELDFLCNDYKSLRARMSCGHAVTPMSLTDWCRRLLEQGERKFVCGQTGCDVQWPFEEVCKMALLTPREQMYFKRKLSINAAKLKLNVKPCPRCKSRVKRTDLSDLCVECTACTAVRKRPYKFCWQCLKIWKGPAPRSDRCENEDCQNPLEILKNCPDITFESMSGITGCPSIRACPTCGLLMEHNKTQCENITCPQCKVEFCFVCLKLTQECLKMKAFSNDMYCHGGVVPRQTSIPVWK